ncbi:MAG: transcriptional regulator [Ignavibacteria bacterium]|nr:transcriptional regulator [Ignavibacteria bacterium]
MRMTMPCASGFKMWWTAATSRRAFRCSAPLPEERRNKSPRRCRCSPSKISRLETGTDDSLTWTDLTAYCQAIDVKPTLLFEPQRGTTAERVTPLVRAIHEQLERLVGIAGELGGEEEIIRKIHAFYGEVLFPVLLQTIDAGERSGLIQPAPAYPSLAAEPSMKRRVAEPSGR